MRRCEMGRSVSRRVREVMGGSRARSAEMRTETRICGNDRIPSGSARGQGGLPFSRSER